MSEKAGPILRSTLKALPVVPMLIALGNVPPAAYAQKCAEANDWSAEIGAQTVCGCTPKEATNIAEALAKGLCAMDPDAVNCAAL